MTPGKLDILLTIQNDTGTTKDTNGEHIAKWTPFCTLWAKRTGVSAREPIAADQIVNISTEEFIYRVTDGAITPTMRVVNGTEIYDIIDVTYIDRNYGKLVCIKVDND